MTGLLPLLSTSLTDVQLLGVGFTIGIVIAFLGYLVYEATNAPPE